MTQQVTKYDADQPRSALAIYAPEQLNVLRRWIAPNFNDAELEAALGYCRALKVDPFAKEVYFWKDGKGRMVMYPGISLRRRRAAESREYQGRTKFEYYDAKTETWKEGPWLRNDIPAAVRVGVWRRGFREPLFGTSILAKDRKNTPGPWQDDPVHMMENAAERRALDGAFPQESRQAARELELMARDEGFEISDEPEPSGYIDAEPVPLRAVAYDAASYTGDVTFEYDNGDDDQPPPTFSFAPTAPTPPPTVLTNDATGETIVVPAEPPSGDDALKAAAAKLNAKRAAPIPRERVVDPVATEPFTPDYNDPAAMSAMWTRVQVWAKEHGTDPHRLRFYLATTAGVPEKVGQESIKAWLVARPENTLERLYELYTDGEGRQQAAGDTAAQQGALV